MTKSTLPLIVAFFLLCTGSVLAADNKHGVGIGLTAGIVDPEGVGQETDWGGVTLFGKIGITNHWGIQILVRGMEDDEPSSVADGEYTQFSVHGVYMWRHQHVLRPHVKFGLSHVEFDAKFIKDWLGPLPPDEDNNDGLSIGGGLEIGSQKIAFFGEVDYGFVDLYFREVDFVNLTIGAVLRF